MEFLLFTSRAEFEEMGKRFENSVCISPAGKTGNVMGGRSLRKKYISPMKQIVFVLQKFCISAENKTGPYICKNELKKKTFECSSKKIMIKKNLVSVAG